MDQTQPPNLQALANRLLAAACEYMGVAQCDALLSGTREAVTVRQFVAYVMVHRCGIDQDDVARVLKCRQATVSNSVKIVKNYGYNDETRELAIALARHLFGVLQKGV